MREEKKPIQPKLPDAGITVTTVHSALLVPILMALVLGFGCASLRPRRRG
jgi:hypothetical protein